MGQKNYLEDSYKFEFTAKITRTKKVEKGVLVSLEDNYFYPESGGQPCDEGRIGEARVLDVQLNGDNVDILLDKEPTENAAKVNWEKRYHHMQQHTGQHLLSASLIELYDADTVGFHLGDDVCSIDITLPGLSKERIAAVETLCSQRIRAALPVIAETVTVEEFKAMPLRKKALPDHITGNVRLIRIGDIDTAHCGGTHLKNSAEIQLLKIIAVEKVKEHIRIHFLAGQRAIADYTRKHDFLTAVSDSLTCRIWDIQQIVEKTRAENKESGNKLRKLSKELASYKAREELENAEPAGNFVVICKTYVDMNPGELKSIASEMTAAKNNLLFCGISEFKGKAAVVLAAGEKYPGDLGKIIQGILTILDGKGGGRGNFAQGMGEIENIDKAIEIAKQLLQETGEQL